MIHESETLLAAYLPYQLNINLIYFMNQNLQKMFSEIKHM